MKLRILPAILLFLFCAAALAERPGDFKIIGPGGGGAMFHPTVSPHDTNTVLIACDMSGSYITHDGGKSWRMFSLRGVVDFFVFDPSDPKVLYAHATGLWRSTDGGEHWNLIYPKPSAVTGVKMASDHSDEDILADPDPLVHISALAIDPGDSKTLYAAAGANDAPALFVSHDGAASWQKVVSLQDTARRLWIDPKSRSLYLASEKSVQTFANGKITKHDVPPDTNDLSLGFASAAQPVIYVTSRGGILISSDAGATWKKSALPGAGAHVRAVATSLHHSDVAYVSYNRLSLDGKKWMGVAKTTDSGATWTLVWKEDWADEEEGSGVGGNAGSAPKNIHDAWITERFGSSWGENPLAMTVADQDPNIAYGTDLGRTMRTSDGGATWGAQYSRRVGKGGWTTTGLDVTTAYGIHFDPFDKNRQFITYTDIGLFRSEDGGASWTNSTDGVPRDWRNTTYWIVFDPEVKGRMWSVNSWTHDLPRPKMWRHTNPNTYRGGVCRSDDGGKLWAKSNEGMDPTGATHILLDPTSPVNHRVLYVAGFGRGVYKSRDDGRTWTLKNNGITQTQPFAWRLARASDGALYVLISRRSEDGSIGNFGDGAMYRSTDAAEHWTPVALPKGANAPNGLAIDPKDSQRLYLTTWARAAGQHGDGGGIFLSEDGGKNWKIVLDKDRHIYDITIDPKDAKVLYATGFESSAWRSQDRGATWTRIPGYNFKWGQRVVPDPQDRNKIYVTTFGGSVWHGSVNGKPEPLDIVTPALEPGQ
ncbi:MAG TPA: hypothetical protein VH088_19660 [Terriglobales bacterium]|jgi:photosystem II stability/assembly factor-like uncharacterized protein|nr:hypothetical protein [Terriglobales bacterium]